MVAILTEKSLYIEVFPAPSPLTPSFWMCLNGVSLNLFSKCSVMSPTYFFLKGPVVCQVYTQNACVIQRGMLGHSSKA